MPGKFLGAPAPAHKCSLPAHYETRGVLARCEECSTHWLSGYPQEYAFYVGTPYVTWNRISSRQARRYLTRARAFFALRHSAYEAQEKIRYETERKEHLARTNKLFSRVLEHITSPSDASSDSASASITPPS